MSEVNITVERIAAVERHPNAEKLAIGRGRKRQARFSLRRPLRLVCLSIIGGALGLVGPPYVGGVYYSLSGDHGQEQAYLDRCIAHIRVMHAHCNDPDLASILNYTASRYHKIGAWDVMVFPLGGAIKPGSKVIGCNDPLCPGITVDPCLLLEEPEDTALVIVHEAMHDYWPCYGHSHINPRERKLYELSYALRRLHPSDGRRLPCD